MVKKVKVILEITIKGKEVTVREISPTEERPRGGK
jgi:hypothetical protein